MAINPDPSSRQHAIVLTCIITPIISSLFVSIRIWTRVFVSRSLALGWDDYTSMLTLVSCTMYSILVGLGTNQGIGWHMHDMSPEVFSDYRRWIYITSMFYITSLLGYKTSILLLYLRLFKVNQTFRYSTWIVLFFVVGYLFCNFWTQLFGCSPPSKFWHPDGPGTCVDIIKTCLAYASLNIISDFVIFVLPLPVVWHLKLSLKEKIGVSLVFTSGAIACIVATVRTSFMLRDLYASDSPWHAGQTSLWMVLEINTGLICGCTPTFKPFLIHIFGAKAFSPGSWLSGSTPAHGSKVAENEKGNGEARFVRKPFSELGSFPSDYGDDVSSLEAGARRPL